MRVARKFDHALGSFFMMKFSRKNSLLVHSITITCHFQHNFAILYVVLCASQVRPYKLLYWACYLYTYNLYTLYDILSNLFHLHIYLESTLIFKGFSFCVCRHLYYAVLVCQLLLFQIECFFFICVFVSFQCVCVCHFNISILGFSQWSLWLPHTFFIHSFARHTTVEKVSYIFDQRDDDGDDDNQFICANIS